MYETYVRSSYTIANLHYPWSNYLRSIWHIIGRVNKKLGATWKQAQILGRMPPYDARRNATDTCTPLSDVLFVAELLTCKLFVDQVILRVNKVEQTLLCEPCSCPVCTHSYTVRII